MIAQLLQAVKLEHAPAARATLVAIRDHLVDQVLALNKTIDLLDIVTGTSAPAADVDEATPESEPRRRHRKKKGKASKPNGRANGHAGKPFITRGGKPSIAARVHEVLVEAPTEGWTSEDCGKRLKGIDARRISITLAGLAKSGRAKKVSYGHYVAT